MFHNHNSPSILTPLVQLNHTYKWVIDLSVLLSYLVFFYHIILPFPDLSIDQDKYYYTEKLYYYLYPLLLYNTVLLI